MAERSPLDAFKDVLSGAARSMARDAEVEVGFTADAPHMAGKQIKVPTPGRNLPREQVALARGHADANALKFRHHNPKIHGSAIPTEAVARAVYDAVEQARVEAIGSRQMEGVRDNLNSALDMRLKSDPIIRARRRDEVPLSTAIALKVRERLTGQAPPESARDGMEMVDQWIEDKAGRDLDALGLALDDQRAFQKLATAMLEHRGGFAARTLRRTERRRRRGPRAAAGRRRPGRGADRGERRPNRSARRAKRRRKRRRRKRI
jgi:cobaltochelatase CobT